ncbi:MAG: hypothetical protein KTR30_21450 [Saprospiraceae bacterium]|nr:hypothetical protein [Saprospiraceae bacterium]
MKHLVLIFASISVLAICAILGFRSMVSHIYNRVDCESFNIDNIEVRTGIDIPAVTDVECSCNEEKTIKTSTFTLDVKQVDLDQYVSRNKFKATDGYFENTGQRKDTKWKAKLDKGSNELTVIVEYL